LIVISNSTALENAMKNLATIPVAAARGGMMRAAEFFAGAVGGFPWFAGTMLAFEAFEVIHLRLNKFAFGDHDAKYEARLMVSEKVDAMFEAGASVMAGASAATIVGRYREHVAANAKRLAA
jgi:hypothetical protein